MSVSPQTFTYKRTEQSEIKADVYRPAGDGVRPVVVWIHGGALINGDRKTVRPRQNDLYLAAGYIVVSIEYRLAPETLLPGILEDLRDAFRWVRTEGPGLFGADAERLAAVGHSAGGYLTLMAGLEVSPAPRALVSLYGYGDIAGPWYSRPDPFYCRQPAVPEEEALAAVGEGELPGVPFGSPRGRFYLYCRQRGLWPLKVTGHDPHTEPRAFDRFCPDRNVTAAYPPTLLIHGESDTDVPYHLPATMADRLAAAGVEHDLVTIPDGPHGFDVAGDGLDDPTVARAFKRVIEFLNRHLE